MKEGFIDILKDFRKERQNINRETKQTEKRWTKRKEIERQIDSEIE